MACLYHIVMVSNVTIQWKGCLSLLSITVFCSHYVQNISSCFAFVATICLIDKSLEKQYSNTPECATLNLNFELSFSRKFCVL